MQQKAGREDLTGKHMAEQIRTAVVAPLFRHSHANHYSKKVLRTQSSCAVVDADEARGRAIAEEFGAEAVTDHRRVTTRSMPVSVAVPTPLHFDVARSSSRRACMC